MITAFAAAILAPSCFALPEVQNSEVLAVPSASVRTHDPAHSYGPIDQLDIDVIPESPFLRVSFVLSNWEPSQGDVDFSDFGAPEFYWYEGTSFIFNDPAEKWNKTTPVAGPVKDPANHRLIYIVQMPDADITGYLWVKIAGFRTGSNGKPSSGLGEEDTFMVAPFPQTDRGPGGRPGVIIPISLYRPITSPAGIIARTKPVSEPFQIAEKFDKRSGWGQRNFSKPKFYELGPGNPTEPGQPWSFVASTLTDPSSTNPTSAMVNLAAKDDSIAYMAICKQSKEARPNKRCLYYCGFVRKI